MIEHVQSVTCTNMHVLGLVINVFEDYSRFVRLAADKQALQTRYPIYFVVKHPWPSRCREGWALRPMKPVRHWRTCFEVAVTF